MKKYLAENWRLILAGVALTAAAIVHTYEARGYFAIGGEWLVLPAILMFDYLLRVVAQDIFNTINFKDGDAK